MGKETRLQFRLSDEKKARFAKCAEKVTLTETALAIAAVDALCDYIEEHGEIRMPLVVLPKSAVQKPEPFFPSAAAVKSPRVGLNEEPAATSASATPEPVPVKLTPTRKVMREVAKKSKPHT